MEFLSLSRRRSSLRNVPSGARRNGCFRRLVTVVLGQGARSCINVQMNWVRLPATLSSVSLYLFFSVWSLFFNPIFPFGLFSFILSADPADYAH